MIGDKLLLKRFLSLFEDGSQYKDLTPFGEIVREKVSSLHKIVEYGGEEALYLHSDEFHSLWTEAIKDSIITLRKFDEREQRRDEDIPSTFGVEELDTYFKDYTEFESVLYGGTKYYRDHVLHVVRVWLLGIYILTENNYIKCLKVGEEEEEEVNIQEKFSAWSLIALTHDLGYPLEKSSQIISVTRNMMKHFITNPVINMDFKFTGVQDTMNDFIIKLMSSKITVNEAGEHHNHIQSKYYFKFLKSLENNKHGVLSAIVIYKMLEYFLESDFNLSEDYAFKKEDKRQFYLRRDILRAISSHTCDSIYQNDIRNFSFLLILCDECQEWGRKSFATMYGGNSCEYNLKNVAINPVDGLYSCVIQESYEKISGENTGDVADFYCNKLVRQFLGYSKWFRDGQNINERNFAFRKEVEIGHKDSKYGVKAIIEIDKFGKSLFSIIGDKAFPATQDLSDFCRVFKREFIQSIHNQKPM